jgi:hypothetical protein
MTVRRVAVVVVASSVLLVPAAGRAQQATGTITGVVRDMSGAALPSASVEAAGPALIEKVRSAVTRCARPIPDRRLGGRLMKVGAQLDF